MRRQEQAAAELQLSQAEVAEAVARSRSWRGALRHLGMTSSGHAEALRRACDRAGIDYSHFRSRAWSDADLRAALDSCGSWRELTCRLGYADHSGSARATVRKHASRLGLQVAHLDEPPRPDDDDPFTRAADLRHLRASGAFMVAAACSMLGHKISWPLEPAAYDLLVDDGTRVWRVQVKTTTWRLNGAWACKITHTEGAQKAWYTSRDIDYFGIVDPDLCVYMIPVRVVDGVGTIIVRHYQAYRLERPSQQVGTASPRPQSQAR